MTSSEAFSLQFRRISFNIVSEEITYVTSPHLLEDTLRNELHCRSFSLFCL
jgi:hypothetical protein